MKTPCLDCKERTIDCHAACDKYKKYCSDNEKIKEMRRHDRLKNDIFWEAVKSSIKRRGD